MQFSQVIIQKFGADPVPGYEPDGLAELTKSSHPVARLIGQAVGEAASDTLSDAERVHVEAIEARRRALEGSEQEIRYRDFGAATRDGSQTPRQMYEGVAKARTVGDLCQRTSKPYRSGLLLMKLVAALKPVNAIELGTCLGISASYQAAAMALNGQGRLVTLEGAEPVAAVARETVAALGQERVEIRVGRFQDVLDGVLEAHKPFDYAFIDGHHDGPATVEYFEKMIPVLTGEACLIFDDIRWSDSMLRAWDGIRRHPGVEVAVDLVDIGLCWFKRGDGQGLQYAIS